MTDEGERLADGIVEITEYAAALPTSKSAFLPWHRPRKQFVRDRQWLRQISGMLDDVPAGDGMLKYLGLPGTDLLDLRFFHSTVCADRGLGLRFLGFNSELQGAGDGQTDLNISIDEVRQLSGVDPRSVVIGDDFAGISRENSIGWKKAHDLGPFDVVNLDLCDGFAKEPPGTVSGTMYDAIARLMALQARTKTPWLFLLTTRAGDQHVHSEILDRLLALYVANLGSCPAFLSESQAGVGVLDTNSLTTAIATPDGFLTVFLCAMCKWLATVALGQIPPTAVELKSVIGYRVEQSPGVPDLVSVAIRFTPTFGHVPDRAGLATHQAHPIDECTTALQALRRVLKLVDVDEVLTQHPDLLGEMSEDMCALLGQARYDVDAYRTWIASGCPS